METNSQLVPISRLNVKDLKKGINREVDGKKYQVSKFFEFQVKEEAIVAVLSKNAGVSHSLSEKKKVFLKNYVEFLSQKIGKKGTLEEYTKTRISQRGGNITMKELVEETGYSECYIRRSFEKKYGFSPKMYEKMVRLQLVISQMGGEDKSLKLDQVATKYGYYDQSHMSKEFKQLTGMTPERYRKMVINNMEGNKFHLKMEVAESV